MKTNWKTVGWSVAGAATMAVIAGCGGGGAQDGATAVEEQAKKVVVIPPLQANVVARWNEVATNTINATGLPAVTDEERRPVSAVDHATVQVAVYDAVNAITGTHKRYAAAPVTSPAGASQEAAVISAAYTVLGRLFPNRSVHYQAAYDADIAALPAGDARTRGIAVGREVGMAIAALRANDGRWTAVTVVPGTLPGEFRGVNPVGQTNQFIRPFAIVSNDQFRADGPPALDSTTYAEDFQEVKEMGGTVSAKRTPEQLENARFHTESPANFPPRNYRNFSVASQSIATNARLMAMIWVALADGGNACFESKYHFYFWRPQSAIPLAGTDGNAATEAEAWTPVVPTPNHPEYPSAHACVNGAGAEVIAAFHGTKKITYSFNSTVTGTTHTYESTDDMMKEMQVARIHGGMHFRTATVHGGVLGMKVGKWIAKHHFTPVD